MENFDYIYAINLLSAALDEKNIPHKKQKLFNGGQILFDWCNGDIICHSSSYGSKEGKYETMGFPWDKGDVTGNLSLQEVMEEIEEFYQLFKSTMK